MSRQLNNGQRRWLKHGWRNRDILRVTLLSHFGSKPRDKSQRGWLLITELSVDGEVLSGNFAPDGTLGYGHVLRPEFRLHTMIRGNHGTLSPMAAVNKLIPKFAQTSERACS